VFATNLDPATLADEAFLRRIQTKIKVDNIGREQFHEITRRVCERAGLAYDHAVVDHLADTIANDLRQPLRACYPRDIVQQVAWGARYHGQTPALTYQAVEQASEGMLVLETDSPYLEPEPRSLRRNEPGLLARVMKRLCEIRGWTPEEADRITTANARELFRLPIATQATG